MKNILIAFFLLCAVISQAQTTDVSAVLVPSNTPTITLNTSSLNQFATVTGTASAAQTFTVTGANIQGIGSVVAPTGFEVSLDGNNYSGSAGSVTLNFSGTTFVGQPVTIWVRVAASASAGNYNSNVTVSSVNAQQKLVSVTAVVSSISNKDSIKINFDTTQLQPAGNNWLNMTGMPSLQNLSVTGGNNNTITVTVVSSAWVPYTNGGCNCTAYPNNGFSSATFAPTQVVKESWFSYNVGNGTNLDPYTSGGYKIKISGLKPTSTYKYVTGATLNGATFNFTSNTEYRVLGISLYGPETINAFNNVATVTTTFTSVQPDSNGNLFLYVNAANNQEMGVWTFFTLTEN